MSVAGGRADTVWVLTWNRLFAHVGERTSLRAEFDSEPRAAWQDDDGVLRMLDDAGVHRLEGDSLILDLELLPGWNRPNGLPAGGPGPRNEWLHNWTPGERRIRPEWIVGPQPFPQAWPLPSGPNGPFLVSIGPEGSEVRRLDGSLVARVPRAAGNWPLLLDGRGFVWVRRDRAATVVGPSGESLPISLDPGAGVTFGTEDPEGNVWLGTVTHGLYRIGPRVVRVIGETAGATDGQVLRLAPGDSGSVLLLTAADSVIRVGPAGDARRLGRAPYAMYDSHGTLWRSEILEDRRRLLGTTVEGRQIEIASTHFHEIVEDPTRDGVLWGMYGGVSRIRPYASGGPVVDTTYFRADWSMRDMLVDPEGVVWVTGGSGLKRITDAGLEEFHDEEGRPLGGGRSLHRTEDGTIWIGTYDQGVLRFRNGEFRAIRAADGLWDDGASTILEDDAGNFWMASNLGVHRVARVELDAFLDGEIPRVRGRGYGQSAGFQNAETSGWPGYRAPDGRMWFPTFSGVAVIDPEQVLAQEQHPPGIRIRGVDAGDGPLPFDPVISLPRGQRRLELSYGAIMLSGHGGVRYEVRLDGVDSDWVDARSQRQVTYGNVPPGRHQFRVRAISGTGIASIEEASVALIVPPFFWETSSFNALMVVFALSLIWFAYHMRVRQLRERQVTLEKLVDQRTHELANAKGETEATLVTVQAQARELRSLDEAKSRFFANVSHELRTPLTLVQGPLQDVLDGRLGPTSDAVREQVSTVLTSGKRLGELVEQLLDVARLESGEFRLHVRNQDLKPLFERLVGSFGALARSRGIELHATLHPASIPARVDADQIEKVFANLLSNASKFTRAGGRVILTVEVRRGTDGDDTIEQAGNADDGTLIVTVEDDGPGIPLAEQQRVFERFHQVDDSSKRSHGGAGLGLALVKEVTELHGGTVELWSEPGRGSRFTVRIPVGGPAMTAPDARMPMDATAWDTMVADASGERSQIHAEEPVDPVSHTAGTVSHDPVPAGPTDTDRPTVLVVEDHDELRGYLRRHLGDDYRVIEAKNGRAGLDEARRTVPDLVLCDIMMPEMDGEELCRAIRSDPELDFLPVIMVTAKASRQSRLSALEGGADDYLVKPFDPEELRLRVGNALASRRRLADRLRADGKAMPFVPIEVSHSGHRDFATSLDAVLRDRMDDEDLDVDRMADALAMSRATLYRKCDDAFGMSPKECLWTFRLRQAAHLLNETDGTVSEIAYACGFKTVPHFTRRFRERFSSTPAAYRRSGAVP
jgi:signal transduction histidine kinase/DNA-binding response OmpR family regulator